MKHLAIIGAASLLFALGILLLSGKKHEREGIEYIFTPKAPQPIGPYSQAVKYDDMVFLSGQIAIGNDGQIDTSDIVKETTLIMNHLQEVLKASGSSMQRVVKTTIYLNNLAWFPEVNKVYGSYFETGKAPARETIGVKSLPKGARVEISMVAALN